MVGSDLAKQILGSIQYATIATASISGKPWNTPVFYAYDDQSNIYWSSHPESIHSKNLSQSSQAFIVIYNSKAAEGEGQGLYIEAKVTEVNDAKELKAALKLLGNRRGKPFLFMEKFMADGPQRIYKASPCRMWINDAEQDSNGDFIKDYRIEVRIAPE
jgi:hypothetical protein